MKDNEWSLFQLDSPPGLHNGVSVPFQSENGEQRRPRCRVVAY